ncbi:MAG: response regulator [Ignavibacteriales bacterium]|nr:response regulator [Ignavibacteriales bacterium]
MKSKILLVDDEEHILAGFKRNLRTQFDVFTAQSAKTALNLIHNDGPFSVIVSDFNMPEMNGIKFLSTAKEIAPDTVRMMLSGYTDLATTIEAVNEGNIFRILTKPCSPEKLISTLHAGIKQYQLITSEKELLEKTLKGTIKVLIEILATVNPIAFSRVSKFQKFIIPLCSLLKIHDKWELEIAILLSQIGLIGMPPDLLEKKYSGSALDETQERFYLSHPDIGKSLLDKIPRLERISEAISYQLYSFSKSEKNKNQSLYGQSIPIVSRILKVLNCFETLVSSGDSSEAAYKKMNENKDEFDPDVLIALDAALVGIYNNLILQTISISDIEPGVVAATDIKDKYGLVLITKGAEITQTHKIKLLNYVKLGHLDEWIKILK